MTHQNHVCECGKRLSTCRCIHSSTVVVRPCIHRPTPLVVLDYQALAQKAGEDAYEAVVEAEMDGDCGCQTCVVREVLTAAWPHLLELAREEVR